MKALAPAAILAALLIAPAMAHAHGEAQWIQDNPQYLRQESTLHCCGPTDCERAPPGSFHRVPGGWRVKSTGQFFPESRRGTYPSPNLDAWWCRNTERVFCIFPAPEGF